MYFLLTISLASLCFTGDHILKICNTNILRAIVDNCTHSLVSILSWLIVTLKCHNHSSLIKNTVFEILLCGFLASAIDVDHFILARSFKLKNAMNLDKKRPLLHCTTVPLGILIVCILISYILGSTKVWRFGWLTWVSIFSHHIRDGTRRGIWLWPFGSTQPLPYYLYLSITLALPYLVMIPLKAVGGNMPIYYSKDYQIV